MDQRPDQRPEGRLIQQAQGDRSAPPLAAEAGISATRWRHIVNGYQPLGGGQYLAVVAPAATLARMAKVVGVTPEQLEAAGRRDAADALRGLAVSASPAPDMPPLPPELDDLVELYMVADEDEREIIRGQVRLLIRQLKPARERA